MKRILIVEDEPIIANIYLNRFRHEGFEADSANDGEAALKALPEFRPDVVLLDLALPKLDGVEVLKRLREQAQFKNIPVVVFSNSYQGKMVEQAWKAGANACLIKATSTPKDVTRTVLRLLNTAAKKETSEMPAATPARPAAVSAPAATPPVNRREAPPRADAEFHAAILHAFSAQANQLLSAMRQLWQQFVATQNAQSQSSPLAELYRKAHALTGNAAVAEYTQMAQLSGALEALLKELWDRPKYINPSTLRTVAQTIDFLGGLVQRAEEPWPTIQAVQPRILVVDDEIISRNAMQSALGLAELPSTVAADAEDAMKQLQAGWFDLVLMDVNLPGMSGFDLCAELRKMPHQKQTPVIFVTGMTDFESRAKSTLSGGNDLIAKPFLLVELAVKALTWLFKGQLQGRA